MTFARSGMASSDTRRHDETLQRTPRSVSRYLPIGNATSVRVRVSLRRIRKFVVHQRELGRGLLTALVECCDALVKFGNIRRSLTGAEPIVAVFLEFLQ